MAPGSQAPADVPAGRSGGKILKTRRTAARKTPYDRPTPPQPEPPVLQSESPSWLGGLVLPVAGGARKILSSFWNPMTWGSVSSSSSESDSESEDGDSGDDENPSVQAMELNQKDSSSQKSEILHLVEQLLMHERYSREECDKLIEIINSRVVDYAGPSMIHSNTNNETLAIMEARKWVAESKVRSGKKPDLDNGLYALKYIMTPKAAEEEGSPVEVAKSYMRTRPPWASPLKHENSPSPSPFKDLFKERSPFSSDGGILFPSTKRDYLSGGSWNIEDEIRKVRSKASEDLLNSHRSMKHPEHSVGNDKSIHADEIVELAAEDKEKETRGSGEGNGIEKEDGNGMEKEVGNGMANDMDEAEKNCFLLTESVEVPVVNNSQDSWNGKDDGLAAKADGMGENQVSKGSRGRGRGRGKGKGRSK